MKLVVLFGVGYFGSLLWECLLSVIASLPKAIICKDEDCDVDYSKRHHRELRVVRLCMVGTVLVAMPGGATVRRRGGSGWKQRETVCQSWPWRCLAKYMIAMLHRVDLPDS